MHPIERLRRIAPVVAAQRDAFEADRDIPQPVVRALREADLLRLWAPRALGGAELSFVETAALIEEAAALEGALGWVLTNAAVASRMAAFLPQANAADWFADAGALMATATSAVGRAERVDGGYRVSGRWPFCSGIRHARHFMGLCDIAGEDRLVLCRLEPSQYRIHDTWHVSGLAGTGSFDVEAEAAEVAAAGVVPLLDAVAEADGPLYRLPLLSIFPFSVALVPPGLARAAIETFRDGAAARVRSGASVPMAEREWVHMEIGRAEARRRGAKAAILDALAALEAASVGGGTGLVAARAEFRATLSQSAEDCVAAVDRIAACAGTAAIRQGGRLERIVRDLDAAVKHIAMSPTNFIVAGRVALGLEPGVLRF